MLKIHVVRSGGYHYYVDGQVPGRAEESLVAGEEPGMWSGAGSAALGLRGTVESQAFAEVMEGRDPGTARSLRVDRPGSVAAYDLTFAAPKSVSLLHLLGTSEIATEVGAGHRAAVTEAAEYLGRSAVGVRRSRAGRVAFLPSTGAVAGQFLHRTSRALDPHLHTHVVAANVAQGTDGRWSAVDSRRVFAHLRAAQGIYHARLRFELSDRIGARWEVRRSGLGDVVGVDRNLRRLFSQRSAAMDEYRLWRSGPSRRGSGSHRAFHATRPGKDGSTTISALTAEWRQRAEDFGMDLSELTRVVGRPRSAQLGDQIDHERVRARLAELTGSDRSIAQRDLVAVVAAASTEGARAHVVESVAARIAEATGPPISTGRDRCADGPKAWSDGVRSREPRWDTGEVVHALEHHTQDLLAAPPRWAEGPGVGAERSTRSRGRPMARDGGPPDSFARRRSQEESHHLDR